MQLNLKVDKYLTIRRYTGTKREESNKKRINMSGRDERMTGLTSSQYHLFIVTFIWLEIKNNLLNLIVLDSFH